MTVTKTVDYSEVHRAARDIVEGLPVQLTETLAERIAAAVSTSIPRSKPKGEGEPSLTSGSTTPSSPARPSRSCAAANRKLDVRTMSILVGVPEPPCGPVRTNG